MEDVRRKFVNSVECIGITNWLFSVYVFTSFWSLFCHTNSRKREGRRVTSSLVSFFRFGLPFSGVCCFFNEVGCECG